MIIDGGWVDLSYMDGNGERETDEWIQSWIDWSNKETTKRINE